MTEENSRLSLIVLSFNNRSQILLVFHNQFTVKLDRKLQGNTKYKVFKHVKTDYINDEIKYYIPYIITAYY